MGNPFLREHLSKGSAAESLRIMRSREVTFQGDTLRGVSATVRWRKGSFHVTIACEECQEHPFAWGRLSKKHGTESFRTVHSNEGIIQGDMLRGVSGKSVRARAPSFETCRGESLDYPFAHGHLQWGHAEVILRTIHSRKGTFQGNIPRGISEPSIRAKVHSKGICFEESQVFSRSCECSFYRGDVPWHFWTKTLQRSGIKLLHFPWRKAKFTSNAGSWSFDQSPGRHAKLLSALVLHTPRC